MFEILISKKSDVSLMMAVCVANGFTVSSVNASGPSDDNPVPPNFVTYQIPRSGSAAMEPGFDSAPGSYMPHGSYCLFSFVFNSSFFVCPGM